MNLAQLLSILFCLAAVFTDLRWRKIYNWLTLPGILIGLLLNIYLAKSFSGLFFGLKGLGLGLLLYLIPFALGWLGGGDVKLIAMLGSFLGARGILATGLASAIYGGCLGLLYLFNKSNRTKVFNFFINTFFAAAHKLPLPKAKASPARMLPYSVAIFLGLVTVLVLKL